MYTHFKIIKQKEIDKISKAVESGDHTYLHECTQKANHARTDNGGFSLNESLQKWYQELVDCETGEKPAADVDLYEQLLQDKLIPQSLWNHNESMKHLSESRSMKDESSEPEDNAHHLTPSKRKADTPEAMLNDWFDELVDAKTGLSLTMSEGERKARFYAGQLMPITLFYHQQNLMAEANPEIKQEGPDEMFFEETLEMGVVLSQPTNTGSSFMSNPQEDEALSSLYSPRQ